MNDQQLLVVRCGIFWAKNAFRSVLTRALIFLLCLKFLKFKGCLCSSSLLPSKMGLTAVEAVMTSLVIGAWLMVALALSRGDFKAVSDSADFAVASLLAASGGFLINFLKKRRPFPPPHFMMLGLIPIGVLLGMVFCVMSSWTICSYFGYKQVAPHTDVWVRQIRPDNFASRGEVFSVPMTMNDACNAEHLKAAICARTQRQVFAVFRHQESTPIGPADTRVEANTADTQYHFIVAEFWVKFGNSTFKVVPATNDVDSLKKAVKAEWDASNPTIVLNIFKLTVKDKAGKVLEVDASLTANTKETAYVLELSVYSR